MRSDRFVFIVFILVKITLVLIFSLAVIGIILSYFAALENTNNTIQRVVFIDRQENELPSLTSGGSTSGDLPSGTTTGIPDIADGTIYANIYSTTESGTSSD